MRDEILNYIIDNTDKATFELALRGHNLHGLYRRKKNCLLYTFFNGNTLRYSNYMTALFGAFISEGAQIEAAELNYKIDKLSWQIRLNSRYRSTTGNDIKKHNELVRESNSLVGRYNELMAGTNKLVDLWNKRHKKLKQAA